MSLSKTAQNVALPIFVKCVTFTVEKIYPKNWATPVIYKESTQAPDSTNLVTLFMMQRRL
jgi:hypothetical protein